MKPLRAVIVASAVLIGVAGAFALTGTPVPRSVPEAVALADRLGERVGIDLVRRPKASYAPAGRSPDTFDGKRAKAQLDALVVTDEYRVGYVRDQWPHWKDVDGNCRDARQDVLAAESLVEPETTKDGCRVFRGLWKDVYTGESYTDPKAMQVDHLVPLAEAYRSGGWEWSTELRTAYANDVTDPRTLVAVGAAVNQAKGDKGPEDWLPPRRQETCRYVADWIAVKSRWKLSMDERERVAVGNILSACIAAAAAAS